MPFWVWGVYTFVWEVLCVALYLLVIPYMILIKENITLTVMLDFYTRRGCFFNVVVVKNLSLNIIKNGDLYEIPN